MAVPRPSEQHVPGRACPVFVPWRGGSWCSFLRPTQHVGPRPPELQERPSEFPPEPDSRLCRAPRPPALSQQKQSRAHPTDCGHLEVLSLFLYFYKQNLLIYSTLF